MSSNDLREQLIQVSLNWQKKFGISPAITSTLSELDAALLVGCNTEKYANCMRDRTAVSKGYDFLFNGKRYQVKANRPSGKKGSKVTLVAKAKNYDWDYLIWILYSTDYHIEEAWIWTVEEYKQEFVNAKRLSPDDMRKGKLLDKSKTWDG